jgi:uncharacterized membrane protein
MNDDIQKEPKNWKWGFIYFNPNDSRSFVPKRVGIGWTINFARPVAYVFLVALILLAVFFRKHL